MVRLAEGDREAFAPVYQLLWPILRRFAMRALAGAPEAEDAAQEALLKVFARAHEFDATRSALPWALSIAAYECKTFRQRQRRSRLTNGIEVDPPSNAPDPEQSAIARDLEASLQEVLHTMNPGDAATLRALLDEQRPKIPGATFRKRLARALLRLKTLWNSRHDLD
jgi:RNA polymerase sigma-70 factor, ECF subfamily